MSKVQTALAPDEITVKRQKEFEAKAREKGHNIVNWRLIKGVRSRMAWKGSCLNPYCRAKVIMNSGAKGSFLEITAFAAHCPYR